MRDHDLLPRLRAVAAPGAGAGDLSGKAIVRERIENIAGVNRTWFEWNGAAHPDDKKLVVEVDFDTDPNAPGFQRSVIEAICETVSAAFEEEVLLGRETPGFISGVSIVPKR
ncbi:hypothetical protein WOC76_03030 [Methylocystis sp. IM3]|uniref:hypothetical protein n=1 Tax=unclassified Methylocystis TaxID=2625913 RepID=UPI0030F6423E